MLNDELKSVFNYIYIFKIILNVADNAHSSQESKILF